MIGLKHTQNSPQPVTDDQIWKNCVFNEEMTSKMQPATGQGTVTEKTWGRGRVVWVVKKKMANISLAFVTLIDLLNSSYTTKADFINCFIIHSKYFPDSDWLKAHA